MLETKTFVDGLMDTMPKTFDSRADAEQAVDIVFSVIAKGLKNRDAVFLHGVGELRSEPGSNGKDIVFAPDPKLKADIG